MGSCQNPTCDPVPLHAKLCAGQTCNPAILQPLTACTQDAGTIMVSPALWNFKLTACGSSAAMRATCSTVGGAFLSRVLPRSTAVKATCHPVGPHPLA